MPGHLSERTLLGCALQSLISLSVSTIAVGKKQATTHTLTTQTRDFASVLYSCMSDLRLMLARQSSTAIVELFAALFANLADAVADELPHVLLRLFSFAKHYV